MLTAGEFTPGWLELREPADAEARDAALLEPLREHLPAGPLVIRDLGCGTGSNRRWLAPRLPGPQRWIMHDRDPALLACAAADGECETQLGDFTTLRADDLAGTSLVTASAVLDVLTEPQVDRLMRAIAEASVPALFTLTVAGEVELAPSDRLDAEVADAFNHHQHRGGRLGPDAATVAADALHAGGCTVLSGRSPWRLGAAHRELTAQWLHGWCAAAAEERQGAPAERTERGVQCVRGAERHVQSEGRPGLELDEYLQRRVDAVEAGTLRVVVQHVDLLALPGGSQ